MQGQVLQEARHGISLLVSAKVSECVFVQNATTGIFTVLYNILSPREHYFEDGDVVLTLSTTYGAIDHAIASLAEAHHPPRWTTDKVEFEFPTTGQEIVAQFEATLVRIKAKGLRPRLAVLETVVSIPAVRMPFEELMQVCQREGIMTLIDGAHSVGQFDVNLDVLQPDFFVADCHKYVYACTSCYFPFQIPMQCTFCSLILHPPADTGSRWLYVPRPCAFLYVAQRNQHMFRSTIPTCFAFIPKGDKPVLPLWSQCVTESTGSAFETLFTYTATSDNMPQMCIPTALRFRREICGGEVAIYEYIRKLAKQGGDNVAIILQTEVLQEPEDRLLGGSSRMRDCAIATVRLPLAISSSTSLASAEILDREEVGPAVRYLTKSLVETYKTWLPIIDYKGWIWVRLCAQIYLEISDFEYAGNALKVICESISKKEFAKKQNGAS
jgi:selenocysteine lyase/cysteine desulfurase